MKLESYIEELYARDTREYGGEYFGALDELKDALNEGRVRAAELVTCASGGLCSL